MKKEKIIQFLLVFVAFALFIVVCRQVYLLIGSISQYVYAPGSQSRYFFSQLILNIVALILGLSSLGIDIFLCVYVPRNLFDRATIERNAERKKAERLAKKREKLQKQLDELPRD